MTTKTSRDLQSTENKRWQQVARSIFDLAAAGELELFRSGGKVEAQITIRLRNHPVCGGAVFEVLSPTVRHGYALRRRTFNKITAGAKTKPRVYKVGK
jgi:hypothetical protein